MGNGGGVHFHGHHRWDYRRTFMRARRKRRKDRLHQRGRNMGRTHQILHRCACEDCAVSADRTAARQATSSQCSHCKRPSIGADSALGEARCYWHEKTFRMRRIDESLRRIADAVERVVVK